MSEIKAIETRYKGYRFRSRLEARWAVFFDTLGIRWEYEPEGYVLEHGPYLPDFDTEIGFVEIKGSGGRTEEDETLLIDLHRESGKRCLLIEGNPWPNEYHMDEAEEFGDGKFGLVCCEFLSCRRCDGLCIRGSFDESTKHVSCFFIADVHGHSCRDHDKCPCEVRGRLRDAFVAARSARFEHGETPR